MTAPGFSVHHRDLRDDVHRHPARLEQRGDVGVARHLVERLEAVRQAARREQLPWSSATVENVAIGGLHPEDAAGGHAAGAAVGHGVGHRLVERGDAVGRRVEKVIAIGGARESERVGELVGELGPVVGVMARRLSAVRCGSGGRSAVPCATSRVEVERGDGGVVLVRRPTRRVAPSTSPRTRCRRGRVRRATSSRRGRSRRRARRGARACRVPRRGRGSSRPAMRGGTGRHRPRIGTGRVGADREQAEVVVVRRAGGDRRNTAPGISATASNPNASW